MSLRGLFRAGAGAAAGIAVTPLLEYGWHAWVAHGKRPDPTRTSHLEHHAKAAERVEPWQEMRENAPRVARTVALVTAALVPLVGVAPAVGVGAGLVVGYAGVTFGHARMHRRAPSTRWEEWMWRFHFHHHFGNARANYGLTSPVFDFVFGTAEVPQTVEIPEGALPAWFERDAPHHPRTYRGFAVRAGARSAPR